MNNLDAILEVAIGLVFVWMILSAATMEAQNIIARLFQTRAKFLEKMLLDMFRGEKKYVTDFFNHPLIQELYRKGFLGRTKRPDYIPNPVFAEVALEIFVNLGLEEEEIETGSVSVKKLIGEAEEAVNSVSVKTIIARVQKIASRKENPEFSHIIHHVFPNFNSNDTLSKVHSYEIEAGNLQKNAKEIISEAKRYEKKAAKFKKNAEKWFDDSMVRASFWYKEKAQLTALVIGFILALALNVDTVAMAQQLWRDPTLRQSLVAKAQAQEASPEALSVSELEEEYKSINLPVGWEIEEILIPDTESTDVNSDGEPTLISEENCSLISWGNDLVINKEGKCYKVLGLPPKNDIWGLGAKAIGILLSAVAAMQGAPFWFEMLQKLLNISGKSKDDDKKEKEEEPVG